MFSINRVPYLFATACSDGIVRFWSARELTSSETTATSEEEEEENSSVSSFEFYEWEMNASSANESGGGPSQVNIGAMPLDISCSYNSRFAVAYKKPPVTINNIPPPTFNMHVSDYSSDHYHHHHGRHHAPSASTTTFADYCVKIFECESTGGSEWKLEDCISLNSIVLPELDSGINLDYIFGGERPIKPSRSMHSFKTMVFGSGGGGNGSSSAQQTTSPPPLATSPSLNTMSMASIVANSEQHAFKAEIPSTAAKMSIRRKFSATNSHNSSATVSAPVSKLSASKKKVINLDWGSTENGSHILTVGLGNRVFVYSCVSKDLRKEKTTANVVKM
jgi:hypothetical protein